MIPRGTRTAIIACIGLVSCLLSVEGADKSKGRPQKGATARKPETIPPQGLSTAELVQKVKPSLVVLSTRGR